jgi:hypothetical protein
MYIKALVVFLIILSILSCGKIQEQLSSEKESSSQKEEIQRTDKESFSTESGSETSSNESSGSPSNGIKNLKFNVKDIPGGAGYKGRIVASAEWEDKNGTNIVLISETDLTPGNDDGQNKELFGYHYIVSGGTSKLWQINDFVKDCPVDVTLEYIPNSLSVTDLNENGIAESTFLYKLSCKGDVSPDDLKLMMHEDDTKYAIRGETLVRYKTDGRTYEEGGKYTPDAAFQNAPAGFFEYAKEQWEKFKTVQY